MIIQEACGTQAQSRITLQVLTPAFTLLLCLAFGLERPSWSLCCSVLAIVAGSALATVAEMGDARRFNFIGFLAFLASALLEAVRVTLMQTLVRDLRLNAAEMLVSLAWPTAAILLGAAFVWEREGLQAYGLQLILARPVLFACALLGGFAVNATTALAVRQTSSLTFKVWGCAKTSVIVLWDMAASGSGNPASCLGYALSVSGFLLFTYSKSLVATAKVSKKQKRV